MIIVMNRKISKLIFSLFAVVSTLSLTSCNSNDDVPVNTILSDSGITITDDVECCSAEEALQIYNFLKTVKNIPELTREVNDKYKVLAYSKTGKFHVGYNDIYFVATKKISGNYVKDFDITNLTPLMQMYSKHMAHSTSTAQQVSVFNKSYVAVKHSWISYVMATSDMGDWSLSYNIRVLRANDSIDHRKVVVDSLPNGQKWLRSFNIGKETYHISLVNPDEWKTGTNTIKAYITRKSDVITTPWAPAEKQFIVEFTPTMPDMGDHSSPGNTPLTLQADQSYQGNINLTMTGLWRIHLTIKDTNGNVVAGGDNLSNGYSSLYFDVTI